MTKVSIIITSFNQADFLVEAIESALAQSHPDIEVIVVDDGSDDGSPEIIRTYAKKYPGRLVSCCLARDHTGKGIDESVGARVSRVRNHGYLRTRGDYICLLDGDDLFHPEKISREIEVAAAHDQRVTVYSNFNYIDEVGHTTGTWVPPDQAMPEGNILADLFSCNFPRRQWGRGELMPRSLLGDRLNDSCLPIYEDLELKLRVGAACPHFFIADPLQSYRQHSAGASRANPELYFHALRRVWKLQGHLLASLPPSQRRKAARAWHRHNAQFAIAACCQHLDQNRRKSAFRLLIKAALISPTTFQIRLGLRCFLPASKRTSSHSG